MDREDLNKKIMERFKKEASDFLKSKNPEEETKEEMIHKFDFVTSEDSSDEIIIKAAVNYFIDRANIAQWKGDFIKTFD
jgi:hypothetical protein